MPSTLKKNAYHILGLDTSASEKEILKRSKEVVNRLKAGDFPDYDLDIGVFNDFRTEENVKDALQRLQAPKKRIKEYFFWFQIADSVDEQVLGLFKLKDYLNAIRIWETASNGASTKAFFYKKNLAILYCLILSSEDNKDYLQNSLKTWKELIDSEKFWISFSKVYKLHDEQTASDDVISEFKNNVIKYLSDIYTELHHFHNNSNYINEFQKVFSVKGEKIEKSILAPAYNTINNAIESLEKMEVSKDGKFDKEESEYIKKLIALIQQELNKLIDLGLYQDAQTKIMRDRSANALRSIVLDLHNNLDEFNKSHGLLEIALQIAGTESLKNQLKGELEQIQKRIKDDSENPRAIKISGIFSSSTIVFKNNFVEHKNKKIFYKDVTGISFDSTATRNSVNGIPTGTTYAYRVSIISEKETISLSFSASRDDSKEKEDWLKLVNWTIWLIEPLVVKRIVDQIFNRGENIKIGDVEFSKQGYSKMKFKWFSEDEKLMVNWSDTIYIPKLDQGNVTLWKNKDGHSEEFATIAMSTPNAVLLPELVQACYDNREK